MHADNADPAELAKFDADASAWWDPAGPFAPLHAINPLRVDYIERCLGPLSGQRIIDVGCGGGLLAEAMTRRGAQVTGIDLAQQSLGVADLHARAEQLDVDYQCIAAETMAEQHPSSFDAVTCLELLEHVPDPASVVRACATLVRPGGSVVMSTINRNVQAWLMAIVGAEYVLGLLPRGTHNARAFIQPAELAGWARSNGLVLQNLEGLHYNPLTRHYRLGPGTAVNYLAHFTRPEAA